MRTLLIIEKVDDVHHDSDGFYYTNENQEKIYISNTAITTFMPRGTQNVMFLNAEIAELKEKLRRAL